MSDHLTLLVVQADFAPYVQVSEYGDFDALMNTHILNAQLYDIRPSLGDSFYADMVINIADVNYIALLDGGQYTYDGNIYFFQGLKKAVVHYAYSRYAMRGGVQDTGSGLVIKKNDWSDPLDIKQFTKESEYHKNLAVGAMNDCTLYLQRNRTAYPNYLLASCDGVESASRRSIRITSIDNN